MDRINKEKKTVSKKLQETAKETERLKQELQLLIASGIQGPENPIFQQPSAPKLEEKPTFKPPVKNIGKHQAQKKDTTDKKTEAELRKRKLKDLQQKASEIVQKNVEAKKRARDQQTQGTKIRSKSSSNVAESGENSKRDSIIISGNSAKSLKRSPSPLNQNHLLQPQKLNFLQVPQWQEDLKKSKSEQSIPAATQQTVLPPSKPPVDNLHWLQEQPQKDHFNFMHAVRKQLKFNNSPKKIFSRDVEVQGGLEELSSPKCLNLDPSAVKHIELNSNQCLDGAQDGTDTSRNISSICSETRSHPVNPNVEEGCGLQLKSSREVKKNQGAIPKRPRDSQQLQLLRNVTLRSNHSDSEEGYTSDFLSYDRQNSMFSVHTDNFTANEVGQIDANNSMKLAGSSVSQLSLSSMKSRKSRKSSWKPVLSDLVHTEPSEKIKSGPSVLTKNITLRQSDISDVGNHSNVLNLKFDLEIHLLCDFNETIQRFSEIEKTYQSFRTNNLPQNIDKPTKKQENEENTFRACQVASSTSSESIWLNLTQSSDSTSRSQLQLEETCSAIDNSLYKGVGGAHLKMFERIIKEEDHRIEHWKKLLKIQEQALLDRTRGELIYLEMQRKQLIETGKLAEASSIKKKQRGILLKHQQERMEMQRMKQMQKEDSRNRKVLLKKERNEIKEHLLSDRASRKVRRAANQKKSTLGPLKVLDSSAICSENTDQEALSVTMSCVEITTGNDDTDLERLEPILAKKVITSATVDDVKKTLLMHERALAKRRKTVEELLQWHKKLLEEEKAIEELEMKIRSIVVQAPTQEDKRPPSESQSILEYIPPREEQSEVTSANYSPDFDVDAEEQSSVSSISRLMENVTKVQDNILNSSVSFKSSVENPLEEDNIPEHVEPDSEQAASSVDDIASVITVEDPVIDTVVSEFPTNQRFEDSVIETSSDDTRSSEGLEEATNGLLSPKPEQSFSVEEVVEEAGNSSPSQQSFENKTDEEKAASLSQKVLPIRGSLSVLVTETLEEEAVSLEVSTVEEEASVANETPESELLTEEKKSSILTEAEELHRKQLAIEQEIKLLKEQQQKDAATPFYLREIPDKPPPPYTPPSKSKTPTTPSVIPKTKEECEQIIEYCVKIIYKAYVCGNLDTITISENTLSLIACDIDKNCYKFVFDLCKEVATDHYSQLENVAGPSWLRPEQNLTMAQSKPLDIVGLKKLMQERVLTQLGFHQGKPKVENSIIKWSKKYRDQVDEALVQELQREDASWTNLEVDATLVKNRITNELMEMVIQDSAKAIKEAMAKKLEANRKQEN